jgi:aspartate kinase
MLVMKFGGTSVKDADAIRRLTAIVGRARAAGTPTHAAARGPLVVVSALSKVTDQLLTVAASAVAGDAAAIAASIEALRARHHEVAGMVRDAARRTALTQTLDSDLAELTTLAHALSVVHDASPRLQDAIAAIGELLSSRIVAAALEQTGLPATWIDARTVLVTDADTPAAPLMDETRARCREVLLPLIARGRVPVLGGFIGATLAGVTTTLGRGGSDYSASLFGVGVGATEIQIWTDVDGMLTADPRVIANARPLARLSFAEASELAYFGAKVLHPSTITPAVAEEIPVRILNSQRPDVPGTLITRDDAAEGAALPGTGPLLTAIACKRDVTVIDIVSTRMLMAHGFLRRLFEVFERHRTAVDVVTTSEVSVSVTIDDVRRLDAIVEDLSTFADVSIAGDMALICAVGERLRTDPSLSVRVVGAFDGFALRMVSQASSRRNITFVLPQADLVAAMQRLHERFCLADVPAPSITTPSITTPETPALAHTERR